jgi:hypothetical protein
VRLVELRIGLAVMVVACSPVQVATSPAPSASASAQVAPSPSSSTSSSSYRLVIQLSGSYSAAVTSGAVRSTERDGSGMICAGGSAPISIQIDAIVAEEHVGITVIAPDTTVGTRVATVILIPPPSRFPSVTPGPMGTTQFGWVYRLPVTVSANGSATLDGDLTQGSLSTPEYQERIAGGWICI